MWGGPSMHALKKCFIHLTCLLSSFCVLSMGTLEHGVDTVFPQSSVCWGEAGIDQGTLIQTETVRLLQGLCPTNLW